MSAENDEQSLVEGFTEAMRPVVARAAALARGLEGRVANAPKIAETSAVKQAMTAADAGTQEIILKGLLEHFPEVCLAAEEDTETVDAFPKDARGQVVVDPIDGTLHSYLEASGPYAVIVGLAVRGIYQAGLVSLPREGIAFDGTASGGAFVTVSGRSRMAVRASDDGRRVLVAHGIPEEACDSLRSRDYEVIRACGGAVSVAPLIKGVCAGLRYHDSALGISIRGRAGLVIAREAGALTRTSDGSDFPNDMQTPSKSLLVVSDPRQLDDLGAALEAAGLGAS